MSLQKSDLSFTYFISKCREGPPIKDADPHWIYYRGRLWKIIQARVCFLLADILKKFSYLAINTN